MLKSTNIYYTNIVKYFCLHHPLLTERYEELSNRFNTLGIGVEWVTNFFPDEIQLPDQHKFKNNKEYSLYKKHEFCINEQVKHNYPYICILEDDVILPDDFNDFISKCVFEFEHLKGDILFPGSCCGISVNETIPSVFVYYHPHFLSRCAHCYILPLHTSKLIIEDYKIDFEAADFKLNTLIQKYNLRCCHTEPSIKQRSNENQISSTVQV